MTAQEGHATPAQFYEIETPSGKKHLPPKGRCWGISKSTYTKLLSEGRIYFGKNQDSQPNVIRYLSEIEGFTPWTWWPHEDVGHTDEAKKEIHVMFGKEKAFETPKPLRLIQQILRIATKPEDMILDSFAGTGTTGHAVLNMNKEEKTNRNFILIELESEICKTITSQRIKKTIEGYSSDSKNVKGTGGGFQYSTLDKPLFDEEGKIDESCSFEDLTSYIYFTETKTILDKKNIKKNFLDAHNSIEYYLIFREIGKNTLDKKLLTTLNKTQRKVIYADKCTISDDILEKYNAIFKQIPYEVRIF